MDSEKIILEPSRNILSFSFASLSEIEIDYSICNNPLQKIIKSILEDIKINLPEDILTPSENKSYKQKNNKTNKYTFEIRANEFNWSLRLSTSSGILSEKLMAFIEYILKSYLEDAKCVYLEINKIIHKEAKFKDILELEYHPLSFRQPDDNIRNWIIQFFQNEFYQLNQLKANIDCWETVFCIGGECTLFGKILSSIHRKYFLTDFQSIYDDLRYNYSDKPDNPGTSDNTGNPENILQIDYKTVSLDWEKYICDLGKNVIIANTGYQGLGENLASELGISKSKVIYLISCNETSFQKDFAILEKKYRMDRKIEIRTNYSVWIYKLLLCLY
jgi:hypothetical protein